MVLNYKKYIERLEKGHSMMSFKREGRCIGNLRRGLIKRYPERYKKAVYGETIGFNKGHKLYKVPKRNTANTETDLTKRAKKYINKELCDSKAKYEVGIWLDNFARKHIVDVWYKNIGYEICFAQATSKIIFKKIKNYLKFCNEVIIVFPKNSKNKRQNKTYPLLREKIEKEGFKTLLIDLTPTSSETGLFPMEL